MSSFGSGNWNTCRSPTALRADPALLCGCVAGAAPAERIEGWLSEAGFVEVSVTPNFESRETVEAGRRAAASKITSPRRWSRPANPEPGRPR